MQGHILRCRKDACACVLLSSGTRGVSDRGGRSRICRKDDDVNITGEETMLYFRRSKICTLEKTKDKKKKSKKNKKSIPIMSMIPHI